MPHLLVASGSIVSALPVGSVVETMRPLALEPMRGTPDAVLGLSVIRGEPIPVVDLRRILGRDSSRPPGRFVVVKTADDRRAALAVDGVLGIEELDVSQLEQLPPLVASADSKMISAIGWRDQQFLQVLRAGRIIPDDVWSAFERTENQG